MALEGNLNQKIKVDLVLLLDSGHSEAILDGYQKAQVQAKEKGYNVLIVGNGRDKLDPEQDVKQLSSQYDIARDTNFILHSHGAHGGKGGKGQYGPHNRMDFLHAIAEVAPKATVDLYSCYGGAAANEPHSTKEKEHMLPKGITLIAHSNRKNSTIIHENADRIVKKIDGLASGKSDKQILAEQVMSDPETVYIAKREVKVLKPKKAKSDIRQSKPKATDKNDRSHEEPVDKRTKRKKKRRPTEGEVEPKSSKKKERREKPVDKRTKKKKKRRPTEGEVEPKSSKKKERREEPVDKRTKKKKKRRPTEGEVESKSSKKKERREKPVGKKRKKIKIVNHLVKIHSPKTKEDFANIGDFLQKNWQKVDDSSVLSDTKLEPMPEISKNLSSSYLEKTLSQKMRRGSNKVTDAISGLRQNDDRYKIGGYKFSQKIRNDIVSTMYGGSDRIASNVLSEIMSFEEQNHNKDFTKDMLFKRQLRSDILFIKASEAGAVATSDVLMKKAKEHRSDRWLLLNKGTNSETALMKASHYGKSNMVGHLIDKANEIGGKRLVRKLLTQINNKHENVLMKAVRSVDEKTVKTILDKSNEILGKDFTKKKLVNSVDSGFFTPLMRAAISGKYEIAKSLVENGADLDLTSNNLPFLKKLDVLMLVDEPAKNKSRGRTALELVPEGEDHNELRELLSGKAKGFESEGRSFDTGEATRAGYTTLEASDAKKINTSKEPDNPQSHVQKYLESKKESDFKGRS